MVAASASLSIQLAAAFGGNLELPEPGVSVTSGTAEEACDAPTATYSALPYSDSVNHTEDNGSTLSAMFSPKNESSWTETSYATAPFPCPGTGVPPDVVFAAWGIKMQSAQDRAHGFYPCPAAMTDPPIHHPSDSTLG